MESTGEHDMEVAKKEDIVFCGYCCLAAVAKMLSCAQVSIVSNFRIVLATIRST